MMMFNTSTKNIYWHNTMIFASIYASFLLCSHHIILIAANTSPLYIPLDNIALDCGSPSNGPDMNHRNWIADTNFFDLQHNASTPLQANESASRKGLDSVPYATARLSFSQFTYSFPITTAGPKFVRLYFYPASYSDFDMSNAYFSVQAGRYTLLSNFSSVLHSKNLSLPGFVKEFCLNVEEGQNLLNLTFTPTPNMPDAYAFINGIEIVSMPANLYYSAENDVGFPSVGSLNSVMRIESNIALQLMYRINVGGQSVSPQNDKGMFRSWDGDTDYIILESQSALAHNNVTQLKYRDNITRYSAPDEVYNTSRMMGLNATINEKHNLTWQFQVDSDFIYLVRFYFCEFYPKITQKGDRVFLIYMANQTAEDYADVIKWSGGNGIPVYKDYAVKMEPKGSEKFQKLAIALHPKPEDRTRAASAILNGLEIFKLSVSDNLASPNPDIPLSNTPSAATPIPKSSKSNISAIIGGAVAGFVALSLLLFFIYWRRSKSKQSGFNDGASRLDQFSTASTKSAKTQGSTLPSDLCRRFSLPEIKEATNNFDSVFIIGVGGFGNVYRGLINDGAVTVAIKRLNPGSEQGAHEFKTEIEMLSQLRYLHLVSLIGYCYEDNEMILVYDYMARGTLRDHLYKTDNPPLTWIQRLEICIGAARGLQYLHSGAKNTIIHRDVKTTNILLDEKWAAKVSDFGLSKVGPSSMSKPHISTVVKGSFGYLDPEYYRLQRLTEKSDVYSFGVVLFEVLSARPPVSKSSFNKPVSLAEWARQCYRKGTLDDIVDPHLKGKIAPDCLKKFFELAVSCLLDNGMDRPSMSDVVWGLEFALQLQETAIKQDRNQTEMDIDMETPVKGSSIDDSSDDLFSSGSGLVIGSRLSGMTLTSSSDDQSFLSNVSDQKMLSNVVFSQIMNPDGR
ncbi:receptor-like protein kinase FERONIA [Ricinus communis]|uniref:receptor-like protein kinase FERONIA n=1 Tax=Ricinus communis TaxID=3988 RepID=UPI00201B02E8|nr:receptor-like protein kinase FERONIA [Ricinus communis]